jgi:hypothetical protein
MGIVSDVEPRERFAHPRNARLLEVLKEGAVKETGGAGDLDGYRLRTQRDLCELLRSLNPACFGGAYGAPVLMSGRGVIFAVARGASYLVFRIPGAQGDDATDAGGFYSPDIGPGWIGFHVHEIGRDVLTKWCGEAQAHANNIELGKKP